MPVILARASQQAAGYRPEGGVERCGYCRFYSAPGNCGRILGPVSPRGWCRYFSRMVWLRMDGGDTDMGILGPPGVTLDLNFMTGSLPPNITFTRASTATYFNSTGTMQTAAVNAPRFDYSTSTHALNGLLIEDARTNLLLNSATLSTQSVTTTATPTTLSFYGTGSITRSGTSSGTTTGTGATTRVFTTFTPTAGTLTLTVTGSVTNAQVEAGSCPTSYIPTTGASVTRAADTATIATSPWYTAGPGSIALEALLPFAPPTNNTLLDLNSGASTNRIAFYNSAPVNGYVTSGGTVQCNTAIGTPVVGSVFKVAMAFASGGQTGMLNAGSAVALGTGATMPTGVNVVDLGTNYSRSSMLDGYLRRFRYWPRVLTTAELQQVTT